MPTETVARDSLASRRPSKTARIAVVASELEQNSLNLSRVAHLGQQTTKSIEANPGMDEWAMLGKVDFVRSDCIVRGRNVIAVKDVHKTYESTVAVAGVSFEVAAGEILGLVGPNGAGKTITLKTLSGVIPPTRGRLSVQGFDVEREAVEVKRRLAYVPDDPQLFPDLSIDQHLAFTAAAYEVEHADDKANALVEMFDLDARRQAPATRSVSRTAAETGHLLCLLAQPGGTFVRRTIDGPRPSWNPNSEAVDPITGGAGGRRDHQFASLGAGRGHLQPRANDPCGPTAILRDLG